MPRFYFHVHDGEKATLDNEGIELPDTAAVREEALAAAREMMSDGMRSGEDWLGWRFEIAGEQGVPLLMVPFTEGIRESGG